MVSPDPLLFDPELEQILRDIARDPLSSLLRVPRPRNPLRLAEEWHALSSRTPGLTLAERHLLDGYRADVAWILRERWVQEMIERPQPSFSLARASALKRVGDRDLRPWQEVEHELEERLAADREDDLLGSLVAGRSVGFLSSEQMTGLLLASERLAPSSSGKILSAQDLVRRGEARAAVIWIRKVLAVEQGPLYISVLWDSLGLAFGSLGNLRAAERCYSNAARIGEPRFNPMAYWLVLAVQTGDPDRAQRASRRMAECVHSTDPFIAEFAAQQERTRALGAWSPTSACAAVLPRLRDLVDDAPRRVLDVFA